MKWSSVLILFAFAFLLNDVLTAIIEATKEDDRKILSPYYDISKSSDCLNTFNPIIQSFLDEIKNQSISCVETAENQIQSEMASANEYRAEVLQKFNATQNTLNICTQKAHAFKYVECLRNFTIDSTNLLNDMNLKTEQFSSQINKIESDKKSCSTKSVESVELKSTSAYSDLKKCLLKDMIPIFELQENKNVSSHVLEIHDAYKKFDSCWSDYYSGKIYQENESEVETCFDSVSEEMNKQLNFKDVLVKYSAQYFSKLNETDQRENTCLRAFVTKYIFPNFPFDLKQCVHDGYKNYKNSQSDTTKFNNGIKEIVFSLALCKIVRTEVHIIDCIYNVVEKQLESEFELQINLRSEEQLIDHNRKEKKFEFDDACMKYFWRRLQFRGLSMDTNTTAKLEDCLNRFYT